MRIYLYYFHLNKLSLCLIYNTNNLLYAGTVLLMVLGFSQIYNCLDLKTGYIDYLFILY